MPGFPGLSTLFRAVHALHSSMDLSKLVQCKINVTFNSRQREEPSLGKEQPMFRYFSKIASRLRAPSIEDRELAYLNASVDRVDLEYRQRQIDRGLFRNNRDHGIF
jgi:hypothetical protein